MRFTYRLEPAEIAAVLEAGALGRLFSPVSTWFWYGLSVAAAALAVARIAITGSPFAGWYLWTVAAFALLAPLIRRRYLLRLAKRQPAFGLEIEAEFAQDEMVARYADRADAVPYRWVRRIEDRPDHVLFWIFDGRVSAFPKRATSLDGAGWREATEFVRERMAEPPAARPRAAEEPIGERAVPSGAPTTPWVKRGADAPVFEKIVTPTFRDQMAVDFPDGQVFSPMVFVMACILVATAIGAFSAFPQWEAGREREAGIVIALWFGGGLVAGGALFLVARTLVNRFFAHGMRFAGVIDAPVRLRFDARGVEAERGGVVTSAVWADLVEIEKGDDLYIFWPSVLDAVWIRQDAFEDDAERKAFERQVEAWYGRPLRSPARMTRERTPAPRDAREPPEVSP